MRKFLGDFNRCIKYFYFFFSLVSKQPLTIPKGKEGFT